MYDLGSCYIHNNKHSRRQSLLVAVLLRGLCDGEELRNDAKYLKLKENSKGYTVVVGRGSVDRMNMIFIVLPRKETLKMLKNIRKLCDNKVFVVASEVSKYAGGYGMLK